MSLAVIFAYVHVMLIVLLSVKCRHNAFFALSYINGLFTIIYATMSNCIVLKLIIYVEISD